MPSSGTGNISSAFQGAAGDAFPDHEIGLARKKGRVETSADLDAAKSALANAACPLTNGPIEFRVGHTA
jgi:hypothetical protein